MALIDILESITLLFNFILLTNCLIYTNVERLRTIGMIKRSGNDRFKILLLENKKFFT